MIDMQLSDTVFVYLFGSVLFKEKDYNDIDILIVYDKYRVSVEVILNYRLRLSKLVENEYNICCDIVLLNTEEENQARFADKENAIRIV
jgi:predicted nucleotidyltransferase